MYFFGRQYLTLVTVWYLFLSSLCTEGVVQSVVVIFCVASRVNGGLPPLSSPAALMLGCSHVQQEEKAAYPDLSALKL